jgi:two-component system, chemotaxis family, chemotaxis protein CheY
MKKILIVDDSDMARASMSFSLKSRKYDVLDAGNGKEALQKLAANQDIGLIITDVNMPEMNGIELVQNLRKNPATAALPVIAITTDEKMGNEIVAKGATQFIIKSSKSSEEIHAMVLKYLT